MALVEYDEYSWARHLTNSRSTPYHGAAHSAGKRPILASKVASQLRLRFLEIQDVKFASAAPDASVTQRAHEPDIVVETWMNTSPFCIPL